MDKHNLEKKGRELPSRSVLRGLFFSYLSRTRGAKLLSVSEAVYIHTKKATLGTQKQILFKLRLLGTS